MFYDVTLLTGADVKTFRRGGGCEKPASGEKELSYQECAWVPVSVSAHGFGGAERENAAVYVLHINEDVG